MKTERRAVTVKRPLQGFQRRTLATGAQMMVIEWTMDSGAVMPSHHHEHEQVGYLVDGDVTMTIGGNAYRLGPGDSYVVPPGIDHAGTVHRSSVMVDVFSPPREDYRG